MKRDLKELISQMTLEEKAGLCSGLDFWHTKPVERLGIPSIMMSDGPHGLRKQESEADHLGLNESVKAVCFPAGCATASSFDVDLMEELGETLGEECQAEDIGVLLGPAVNIKRSPLCGRNFEYLSEDPHLAGKLSAAYIRGVQKCGIGTSIKHFAANSQEYRRMSSSSELSERTLHEIYLPAFEEAVKEAKPRTVMCSYNKINGTFASENRMLLTEILRENWGYEGAVVTDWGAVNDRVEGIRAGLDLEMPATDGHNDIKIVQAVCDGALDERLVDEAAERVLEVVFDYVDHRKEDAVFDRDADHEKAVRIESECAVLLENNGILPLDPEKKVLYIGEFAEKPRYQGGGSSHINSSRVVSALEAAQEKRRNVTYVKGFPADRDERDAKELEKAVSSAQEADVVVIFAGLPDVMESEGYDRSTMAMPGCQNELIREVLKVKPDTVVVLHNGSPVETPWADDAAAVLEMYLGGQGVGEACDRILYGEVNPSGRLAETFPVRLKDTPCYMFYPGDGKKAVYGEEIFVGYRYYDTKKIPVRWAFGHGLSYTEFRYSNLRVGNGILKDKETLSVSVDITNAGSREGKEVVQMYISDRNGTPVRPEKELKGFAKVSLQPGEAKTVRFEICPRDLAYYEEEIHDWYAPAGTYRVLIGHASDDIVLEADIEYQTECLLPLYVDGTTTVGDLLADPRTAQAAQQIFLQSPAQTTEQASENVESEADKEMLRALMEGMPLKSLVSLGAMTWEQEETVIKTLNGILGNEKRGEER